MPGAEVRIFVSSVKVHAKICTHCWNINKSYRGELLFVVLSADLVWHTFLVKVTRNSAKQLR